MTIKFSVSLSPLDKYIRFMKDVVHLSNGGIVYRNNR